MSMLSAQVDKLRERAVTLRQGRWSDGADDARLMEDAAETILFLRDRAQDLQAENAKLRELADRAWKSAERLCQAFDGPCRDDGVTIAKPCPMGERDEECVYGQLQKELRECGVEVDA